METKKLEYKREIKNIEKQVIRPIIAFANTSGGTLKIGYDDKGKFFKIPKQGIEDDIWNTIWDTIEPIEESKDIKMYRDQENCIVITVDQSNQSWFNKRNNKYYIRYGSTTREVEKSVVEKTKNDLSPSGEKYKSENFEILSSKDPYILNLVNYRIAYHLVDKKDYLTQIGLLFKDSTKKLYFNTKEFNVVEVDMIINEIKTILQMPFLIGPKKTSVFKEDSTSIIIIRELISNALAHSSFPNEEVNIYANEYGAIFVNSIYPDSDFKDMVLKSNVTHSPTNPYRNKILKRLNFIEELNEGYQTLIISNELYQFLYSFDEIKNVVYIWLIFRQKIESAYNCKSITNINKVDQIDNIIPSLKLKEIFFQTTSNKLLNIKNSIIELGDKND